MDSRTPKNVDGPQPLNLAAKAKRYVHFMLVETASFGKDRRDKHSTRSPSPGGKGKKKGKGKGGNKPPAASAAAAPATSILRRSVVKTVPSSVALAASNYDLGPRENYRSWLLDTGCKYDLTTRAAIPSTRLIVSSGLQCPCF